jgi:hypothetical protein
MLRRLMCLLLPERLNQFIRICKIEAKSIHMNMQNRRCFERAVHVSVEHIECMKPNQNSITSSLYRLTVELSPSMESSSDPCPCPSGTPASSDHVHARPVLLCRHCSSSSSLPRRHPVTHLSRLNSEHHHLLQECKSGW